MLWLPPTFSAILTSNGGYDNRNQSRSFGARGRAARRALFVRFGRLYLNGRGTAAGSMPMPLSDTEISVASATGRARTTIRPPGGVHLTALSISPATLPPTPTIYPDIH
jgi:hypothetical protein